MEIEKQVEAFREKLEKENQERITREQARLRDIALREERLRKANELLEERRNNCLTLISRACAEIDIENHIDKNYVRTTGGANIEIAKNYHSDNGDFYYQIYDGDYGRRIGFSSMDEKKAKKIAEKMAEGNKVISAQNKRRQEQKEAEQQKENAVQEFRSRMTAAGHTIGGFFSEVDVTAGKYHIDTIFDSTSARVSVYLPHEMVNKVVETIYSVLK